jgi:hypothetical protein
MKKKEYSVQLRARRSVGMGNKKGKKFATEKWPYRPLIWDGCGGPSLPCPRLPLW